ncbi:MAG: hypothetical protein J1F35_06700 [Erysipelotrichales bacterium]|nr:hypothetical protein [Erysipelotrichales bacterium]
MKTRLTTEQSQHLIGLGVPKEKASGINIDNFDSMILLAAEAIGNGNGDKTIRSLSSPIFQLDDFLNGEILPKEISYDNKLYELHIDWMNSAWWTSYQWDGIKGSSTLECKSEELIDALYKLTCGYYDKFKQKQ